MKREIQAAEALVMQHGFLDFEQRRREMQLVENPEPEVIKAAENARWIKKVIEAELVAIVHTLQAIR